MAKYLPRSCPKCNGYLGIVVPERKRKMPVQAINGRCLKMWLSAGVGISSRKNVGELSAPRVDWYKRIIREVLEKDRMLFPKGVSDSRKP